MATAKGRTGKSLVFSEFCEIENRGSGGMPVIWLPLMRSCLPKIYHVEVYSETIHAFNWVLFRTKSNICSLCAPCFSALRADTATRETLRK